MAEREGDRRVLSSSARWRRPVRRASLATQTEQILRERLRHGDLHPGDQLPPEHQLASDFGVSRATVRTAITSLARRGLIVQRHGVGNFVAAGTLLSNDLTEAVDLNVLLERGGATPAVLFDAVGLEPAPAAVADGLGIAEDDPVLRSAKRFTANGATVIYVVSSVPVSVLGPELAEVAARTPDITEPLFAFLEESAGVSTAFQLASLEAQLGSAVDHPANDVAADLPVLQFDEVGYTADNEPIWHSRNWYPPSAMSFELIRHRAGLAA